MDVASVACPIASLALKTAAIDCEQEGGGQEGGETAAKMEIDVGDEHVETGSEGASEVAQKDEGDGVVLKTETHESGCAQPHEQQKAAEGEHVSAKASENNMEVEGPEEQCADFSGVEREKKDVANDGDAESLETRNEVSEAGKVTGLTVPEAEREEVEADGRGEKEAKSKDEGMKDVVQVAEEMDEDADADTLEEADDMADADLDDGGLPTFNDIDLSLLGREKEPRQGSTTHGAAHRNVAVSKAILTAELAAEIYRSLPDDRSENKPRSTEVSQRYGVAPKTIRDVWDRKTWFKATQHLFVPKTRPGGSDMMRKIQDLPPPSSEILLATIVSTRLEGGKYLVKLDHGKLDDKEQIVECYHANLHRLHPVHMEPADPAWAEAEAARRVVAEEAAARAAALAVSVSNAGARKRGRRSDGKGLSQSSGVASQGGVRAQRNTLEGRCRTVIARILRSETTANLGDLQEALYEEDIKEGAVEAPASNWLVRERERSAKRERQANCIVYESVHVESVYTYMCMYTYVYVYVYIYI